MKKCTFALLILFLCSSLLPAAATDFYVSKARGDNGQAGTAGEPLKNIDAALAKVKAGDTIHVAGGIYFGLRDRGYIEVPMPVTLLGGYSDDFANRDPLTYHTLLQPTNESAGKSRNAIMALKTSQKGQKFVVDGFIFDGGERNVYSSKEGKPEGCDTGRLLLPTEKTENNEKPTVEKQGLFIENLASAGDVLLQNNTFVNCPLFAVQGGHKQGTFTITNNVFVANRMGSIEIFGTGGKKGPKGPIEADGSVEVSYNTILFSWSRTKSLDDMGYGVRIMTMLNYNIHHNIIGGSVFAAVDHTRFNRNEWIQVDNNIFFANKQAPLLFSEPGNVQMERVKISDFGDLGLASTKNNKDQFIKLPIDQAYLEGFLNASYTEQADVDPNSNANLWRAAMGMNIQGTLVTNVSMFANRYPWQKALELFGANADIGAQAIIK